MMLSDFDGACPNCSAQVVLYPEGFTCSVCEYTSKQWAAFLVSNRLPLHTDSPALVTT